MIQFPTDGVLWALGSLVEVGDSMWVLAAPCHLDMSVSLSSLH